MGAGSEGAIAVLGAGPAGLTAGYVLARDGRPVIVCEAGEQVGGLARTVVRDGYRFDLGGHRFFTKSDEVRRLWHEILGDELLVRARPRCAAQPALPVRARDAGRRRRAVVRVGAPLAATGERLGHRAHSVAQSRRGLRADDDRAR